MGPLNITAENIDGGSNILGIEICQFYFLLHDETKLGHGFRAFLYFLALAYCFIGLSAITARFFLSMENVVKHTRTVEEIDPCTNTKIVRHKKVWNYTIADITLLAFGTSFPQISLATIDAIRNLGNLARTERPEDWVPVETVPRRDEITAHDKYSDSLEDEYGNGNIVIHSNVSLKVEIADHVYQSLPVTDLTESSDQSCKEIPEKDNLLSIWKQQFIDAIVLESSESRKLNNTCLRAAKIFWELLVAPWRILFAFVPPCQIAHGWISFILSLIFISGIAYIVTKLTDLISCVTGIDAYVIAFTALAAGTSWPDLVASKIAAERQITADSAIANITCSNSVNIYVGIGVPWLIDTLYNYIAYKEPLRIENAGGLSFSLLVFFATSVGCIGVLVFRRLTLGAELGGPKFWAWAAPPVQAVTGA
ncbi:hypothetical protein DH2020_046097 [Rehmannia glutinosa]|uniref:Sodium/calcium exchanger membrane region domain-containing protein n=1 Tax=Rehmannia glutinosa TaxID=99300 RepID=A0ABR0UE09_REHGL